MSKINKYSITIIILITVILVYFAFDFQMRRTMGHSLFSMFSGMQMQDMYNKNENIQNSDIKYNLAKNKKNEIVTLKDGDSYTLKITKIKHIINDKEVEMLGYNDTIPGPVIKVEQGAEIKLRVENKMELSTSLHSHGLRGDYRMDGVVKGIHGGFQDPILKDGFFEYSLKFPDSGIYWYHPHLNESVTQELGLYGNFLVTPKSNVPLAKVNREEILILDDVKLDNRGDIFKSNPDQIDHTLMGRYGNVYLLNGESNYLHQATNGEVVRYYITNTANARPFNFSIPGAKLKRIGGDNGYYGKDEFVTSQIILPSERYIFDIYFPSNNNQEKINMMNLKSEENEDDDILGQIQLLNGKVEDYSAEFNTLQIREVNILEFDALISKADTAMLKNLQIDVELKGNMNMDDMPCHVMGGMQMGNCSDAEKDKFSEANQHGNIEWEDDMSMMNEISTNDNVSWILRDTDTNLENMDINWNFKKGDIVKIIVENSRGSAHPMQHPIHIHGQRAILYKVDGVVQENNVWKDSFTVPMGAIVEILVEMTNPGTWMTHCHISEHLENGMSFSFNVSE